MKENDNQNKEEFFYVKSVEIPDTLPGMRLAGDVLNDENAVILRENAVLTELNIEKLKMNLIKSVLVKTNVPPEKEAPAQNPYAAVPVENRLEFKEFEKNYISASVDVKKVIMAIGDGAEIKLEELYKMTDGIMSKLSRKSDVLTFLASIKSADEHTFTHSNNVSLLCNLFSRWLNYDETSTMRLTCAGVLHDIGKTRIPNEVLNKKGRLTDEEFRIIKKHTVLGYKILVGHDIPKSIHLASLMHHEKINGKGYPTGVTGDRIDAFAKIVSICDIYDAMTANRAYRPKLCPFEVIREFERNVFGELDTEYLLVFLRNIAHTYVDAPVKLNDGRAGIVIFINNLNLSKPIVRLDDGQILDLSHIDELQIASMI